MHGKRIEQVVVTSHGSKYICEELQAQTEEKERKLGTTSKSTRCSRVHTCEQLEPVWQRLILTSAEYSNIMHRGRVFDIPNISRR